MTKKVLLFQPIHSDAINRLKEEVTVEIAPSVEEGDIMRAIGDADGIIVRVNPVTKAMIDAGKKLKVIARHGVGLDLIDIQAATDRRIPVVFSQGSNTNAVAEHAAALMLALSKKIIYSHEALTKNGNYKSRLTTRTTEIRDKTVGVVGMGQIGRRFATICQHGFGAKIIAYDPYINQGLLKKSGLDVKISPDLEGLLRESDIISIHAPATADNHKLFGSNEFQMMKKTALLINTGRGELVDESALCDALVQGKISGAAIDVYDPEPPESSHPLFSLANVVATPHVAAHSEEGLRLMAMMAAEQVLQVLRGEAPPHVANPEALK